MNTPDAATLHRGYWCECWTQSPATGETPTLLMSFRADTPQQAVRWIRIALRTMASGLQAEEAERAWTWLTEGYLKDINNLNHDHPRTVTITHADTHISWTARPALFLPTAHGHAPELPGCSAQFSNLPRLSE